MEYTIKKVKYDNQDFQNSIFPERKNLKMSALAGLEKLEIILIIYDNNRAIACGGLKPFNNEVEELARMFTDNNYRGQGLAKKIIKEVIDYAKKKGYQKIILDTWKESTSARNLYTALGFKERSPFDKETFQNSFSTYDPTIREKIQEKLVFMELNI